MKALCQIVTYLLAVDIIILRNHVNIIGVLCYWNRL
jgi:hypothetical protein